MPAVFKGAGILVAKGGCPCAFRGHLVWALAFWLLKVGVLVLVACACCLFCYFGVLAF